MSFLPPLLLRSILYTPSLKERELTVKWKTGCLRPHRQQFQALLAYEHAVLFGGGGEGSAGVSMRCSPKGWRPLTQL